MNRKEKIEDIQNHPENHKHDFCALMECCTDNGGIDGELILLHETVIGDLKHDATTGPCCCGAWH